MFSLGRLVALVVFAVLMVVVLLLVAMLVVPPELLKNTAFAALQLRMENTVALICATFFVITLVLWSFDAVGFFPFRNPWMSKAIWGACISSIIATSLAFYKSSGQSQRYPFEGVWFARARYDFENRVVMTEVHTVVMTYNRDTGKYVGHSDIQFGKWFFIKELDVPKKLALLTITVPDGASPSGDPCFNYGEQTAIEPLSIDDNQSRIAIGRNSRSQPVVILQRNGPINE